MNQQPKVSVLLAVYNVETYLAECMDSILGQTLKEIEIVCIDNCSTDNSYRMLQEYEKKDSRIKLIQHERNMGLPASRNTASQNAQGEYIYFMDSDDWIEADTLEVAYQEAKEKDLDILFFEGVVFYENEDLRAILDYGENTFRHKRKVESVLTGPELFEHFVSSHDYESVPWTQLIRRSFYEKHNISFAVGMTYCEDMFFSFQNIMAAERVFCIHEGFYHYRIRANSVMTNKRKYSDVTSTTHTYMRILLIFLGKNIPESRHFVYFSYFEFLRNMVCKTYFSSVGDGCEMVEEALINLEKLLFGKPLISTLSEAEFLAVRKEKPELCFFGAGKICKNVLGYFKEHQLESPLAICDNGKSLHGTEVDGVPVCSFQELCDKYKNLSIVITNKKYYSEIYQQVAEVLGEDRILYLPIYLAAHQEK